MLLESQQFSDRCKLKMLPGNGTSYIHFLTRSARLGWSPPMKGRCSPTPSTHSLAKSYIDSRTSSLRLYLKKNWQRNTISSERSQQKIFEGLLWFFLKRLFLHVLLIEEKDIFKSEYLKLFECLKLLKSWNFQFLSCEVYFRTCTNFSTSKESKVKRPRGNELGPTGACKTLHSFPYFHRSVL